MGRWPCIKYSSNTTNYSYHTYTRTHTIYICILQKSFQSNNSYTLIKNNTTPSLSRVEVRCTANATLPSLKSHFQWRMGATGWVNRCCKETHTGGGGAQGAARRSLSYRAPAAICDAAFHPHTCCLEPAKEHCVATRYPR